MSGYLHADYAQALSEFGTPLELPRSGGWLLKRSIADFDDYDASGCYPIFACRDWSKLRVDLDQIADHVISLSLVTDPFGEHNVHDLRECFPNVMFAYKEHFVIDLALPIDQIVSAHHARNVRKARRLVEVERCADPLRCADEWIALYANLVQRHRIKGIAAFSRESFLKQLQVPGLEMFRAVYAGETVGIVLWYTQNDVGYYHLAAYNDMGYELRASFALFACAIEYFSTRLRWLSLGAGAGLQSDANDGLTRFKRGWASGTRTAYFCGRIFDAARYAMIVQAKGVSGNDYFPIYRKGEFA